MSRTIDIKVVNRIGISTDNFLGQGLVGKSHKNVSSLFFKIIRGNIGHRFSSTVIVSLLICFLDSIQQKKNVVEKAMDMEQKQNSIIFIGVSEMESV